MKYYQPRFIDGGYVYGFTGEHDTEVHRAGYCALLDHVHYTPEEAITCFREFLLNASTNFNLKGDTEQYCRVCNRLTKQYALVVLIMRAFALCPDHQNIESVNKLLTFTGYFAIMERTV